MSLRLPMISALRSGLVVSIMCVAMTSCGKRDSAPELTSVNDFLPVSTYGHLVLDRTPDAEWQPGGTSVVAAEGRGLVVLSPGAGNKRKFRSPDGLAIHQPQWWDGYRILASSEPYPERDDDGRVLPAPGAIRVLIGNNKSSRVLTEDATRPRPWRKGVVAVRAENMLFFDGGGNEEALGEGFEPEPQAGGLGLAWRDKPLDMEDWWTGINGNGSLIVRWGDKATDLFDNACQPRWSPRGGMYYTALHQDLPEPVPHYWSTVPTSVWFAPGPGQEPKLVAVGAHSCDPNPVYPLVAYVTKDGAVKVQDAAGDVRQVDDKGTRRVRWSSDGKRLLMEQEPEELKGSQLVIQVFALRAAGES